MTDTTRTPRVSILVPCYNAEPYLSRCLDSLLTQTYRDFEIIAIDDGSQDGTPRLLASYAQRDPRIHVIRNPSNLGLIRTLNRGIERSGCEYVARMDADDESEPSRIGKQVAYLDTRAGVDVVSCAYTLIDGRGRLLGERPVWVTRPAGCRYVSAFATPIAHAAMMARRSCLLAGYSTDPRALHTEDYELWCRLIAGGKQLSNIREPLYRVRISPASVSASNERIQVENFLCWVRANLAATLDEPPPVGVVRVLANRIAFSARDIPLVQGLQLLERLMHRGVTAATAEEDRGEIRDATAIQRVDILLQCLLKGRPGLRVRAASRLARALWTALERPRSRRYLTEKIRVASARAIRGRRRSTGPPAS